MKRDLNKEVLVSATIANTQLRFTDADVVNPDEWATDWDCDVRNNRPNGYLFHDHGFTLAVVVATSLADALDILADEAPERISQFLLDEKEASEYEANGIEPSYLGNDCSAYDIESLSMCVFSLPRPSLAASLSVK